MKGVIILLALCALQTVLADFRTDLNNKHTSSMQETNAIVKKLREDIRAAYVAASKSRPGVVPGKCWDDYKALKNEHRFRHDVGESCYYSAMAGRERARQLQHERDRQRDPAPYPEYERHRERQSARELEAAVKDVMSFATECYKNNIAAIVKEAKIRRDNTVLCFHDHFNVYGRLPEGVQHPVTRLYLN